MKRRLWMLILFVLVTALAYWLLRRHLPLEYLVEQELRLRELVDDHPVASLAIGFGVYFLFSLVPGTGGKSVVFGWLFGFWAGLILVNVALTAAAVVIFLLIRRYFCDWIHEELGAVVRRVDVALQRDGVFYLLLLRISNAPYSLINYAVGATTVRTRTFWWTTQVGILPGNIAFVLAGSQLPTLRQIAERGLWSLIDLPLLLGLSLVALLPLAARWVVRRWYPASKIRDNAGHRATSDHRETSDRRETPDRRELLVGHDRDRDS